ncbi:phosphate ABC transporter substrate-binding protein PstS [Mycobacterium vulneris]|uniref:Phosphate-binding protein n=1 Tax=Mycolicibacterium vulneris TaxID=547163 RepID=A0A1X2L142_9MYCO|nr:phosphate ABC transporter substrate-binding protein PstS [Mycolicibacterium vulneris]OSC27694.1 phosphate ABC transporter substrate-binding protein PstS [Mycolicibacterium vulneris]
MNVHRAGAVLVLLAAGALALGGCGSATHASSSNSTAAPVQCGGKKQLKGSGATAQENAMEQFVFSYVHACPGYTLDYNANGSGAGVTDFVNDVSDLAGSGDPLDPSKGQVDRAAQRCGSPAWDLPTVFEPIAITYNLPGVSGLILDAPTLARIFNGGISRWDDPAIKALNPGTSLPSTSIHVFYRSDQSGDTSNFQQYLVAAAGSAWGRGAGQTFLGGVGDGGVGDNGTSAQVQSTDGSITYNEWSFAVGRQLTMVQVVTLAGPDPVQITVDSVSKTIAGAAFKGQGNDLVVDTSSFYKPTQPGAYPIVEPTYEIVCSKYPDSATGAAVKAFMQAAIGPGQVDLDQYGSIPLPAAIQSKISAAVNAIS